MTKPRACPHCGAGTEPAFVVGDLNRRISGRLFSYSHCPSCGVYFLENLPQDLTNYYPDDYYIIARSLEELAAWSASERYKIELVKKFRKGGRLIEVGPASGSFSYLAKQAGFDVTAIEMDRRCCDFLSHTLKVDVINSADEAIALSQAPMADVIAMWHVIEHLIDPWQMLEIAAQKLNPGGVVVIAAPNPEAFQFSVLGGRWVHVDAPRHVWLIPSSVIVARGNRLGLQGSLVTTRDAGSLGWNRFGWEYTMMNRFSSAAMRRIAALLGRLFATVISPFESREGRGAAYTVVLQKPEA